MEVRRAMPCDFPRIMQIYGRARKFMEENGNPTQWGYVYPPENIVREDIEQGILYVLVETLENQGVPTVCGVFAFLADGDKSYDNIVGNWLNDLPHAAIHRVASSGDVKGIIPACIDYCLKVCRNLKIDTHKDNTVMQHQLTKLGFLPCGTVFTATGSERIAYQLYKE